VQVSATTTSGAPLPEAQLAKVLQGCEMLLQLDDDKRKVGVEVLERAGRCWLAGWLAARRAAWQLQ
jgi:hypothetical protein